MFSLPVCACDMCVPGARGIQKRVLDRLKLKLEMVVELPRGRWQRNPGLLQEEQGL